MAVNDWRSLNTLCTAAQCPAAVCKALNPKLFVHHVLSSCLRFTVEGDTAAMINMYATLLPTPFSIHQCLALLMPLLCSALILHSIWYQLLGVLAALLAVAAGHRALSAGWQHD